MDLAVVLKMRQEKKIDIRFFLKLKTRGVCRLKFKQFALTRDGLFRRPGAKSASSSLNVALFVEKFKPFSPQYENPDKAASLQ